MTRRTSNKQHSAPKTLPDYQMFPVGMWPMFGAVLLMLACLVMTVLLISDIAALWVKEQTLMYLELAAWVLLSLILSTSTFLLSRGYCIFHRFLIWHNRAYMLLLAAATLFAWLAGTTSMVLVGAMGLSCALLAHWLYCSKKYSKGVEHYRLIWAHFRAQKP
ncbi:hypothetical protein V6U78_09280 [Marinospirillum sp. MEB164]|uniref:Uncharacterized protein n=1 Tax=Marinospirillum alkalitolerans TaxID=3123374 RepID=A0ABW8PZ15_9GAMM